MNTPRLKDIARSAGVSAATVTRVVRGSGYVSSEKREQVFEAMRQLGYQRAEAPAVKPGVPLIAILSASAASNWLFTRITEAVTTETQKKGWFTTSYLVNDERAEELVDIIERMRLSNLKGVVFNCLGSREDLMNIRKYLTSLTVPLVMIERSPEIYGLNRVMINSKEAVFLAVRHLAHYGHRKILFLSPDIPTEVEQRRIEGFRMGTAAMNIEKEAFFVHIPDHTKEYGYEGLQNFAASFGLPTAIIGGDPVIVGVLKYLYEKNVRVPQQVSLVSLDDSIASLLSPPLTSIAFPFKEIAENTVQIIQDAQSGSLLPKTVYLSTRLVERDTVARAASEI